MIQPTGTIKAWNEKLRRQLPHRHPGVQFKTIIDRKLYLGNRFAAMDIRKLRKFKITHILNITQTVSCHYKDDFEYKTIRIKDRDEKLADHFNEAIEFIDKGERVLVHCRAGVSRSASIVIAYLIKKKEMTFNDAFTLVKEKKPNINPALVFRERLVEFEISS